MPNNIQAGSLNSTPYGSTWLGGFDDEPPLVFGSTAASTGADPEPASNEPEWQEEVGSNALFASRGTLYALNGGQATALRTPPVEEVRTVHHVNGIIIFAVVDWENEYSFYGSDGTAAGTKLLYGPIEGAFSSLEDMRVVDGEVYLVGEDDVRDEAFVGIIGEDGSFRAETASLDEVSREELLNYVRNLSDVRPTGAVAPELVVAGGPAHGMHHDDIGADFHDTDHPAEPAIHDDALNTDPADAIGASNPAGEPKGGAQAVAEAAAAATPEGEDGGASSEPGTVEAGDGGNAAEPPAPADTASTPANGGSPTEPPASGGVVTVLPEIVSNTPILDDDDDGQFIFTPPPVVSVVAETVQPVVAAAIDLGEIGISYTDVIESASAVAAAVTLVPEVEDSIAGLGDLLNPLLGDHLFS